MPAVVLVSGEALRVAGPGLNGRPEAVPTGALLGEMAMLIETEYSSTVVARTAVRALRLTRAGLHAQMAEDAELAEHFVLAIAGRLRHLALELREVETSLSDAASTGEVGGEPPRLPHVLTVARENSRPAFSCCSRRRPEKRKRPTPGGEVGRYGAFARAPGGKPAPQAVSSARRGALPIQGDTT